MNHKIVLLHGALGCSLQLQPLADNLSKAGFTALSFDFSGHGKSIEEPTFGVEEFAIQLLDFLDREKIDKAQIFGYSMGGYVALKACLNQPDRIERIACLGTKFDWNPEAAELETRKLNPEKILEKVPAFAIHLENMHGKEWPQMLRKTASMMRVLGSNPILKLEDFKGLHLPVRLLLAEHDELVTKSETIRVATALPNAAFSTLPNMFHPIEKVNPSTLSYWLIPFFRQENRP